MLNLIFEFNGGLGNQIFQYLASRYLKKELKNNSLSYYISDYLKSEYRNIEINKITSTEIKLVEKREPNLNNFVINKALTKFLILSKKKKFALKNYFGCLNSINEKDIYSMDPGKNTIITLEKKIKEINYNKNLFINIEGYWQNPDCYINHIEDFQKLFKDYYNEKTIFLKNTNYISIHIRRGDYINDKKNFKYYFSKFSPLNYIISALNLLPQEVNELPIYIITDDIKWATKLKEIIQSNYPNKISVLCNDDPKIDWTILRSSRINICANSTFSYSAAILNNKNISSKLRCIIPQWISNDKSSKEMGWISFPGFFEL